MELYELKQKLKNNELSNLYIFHGEEIIVEDTYIEKIVNLCGLKKRIVAKVSDISNNLKNNSIFQSNFIYIIRNDQEFIKNTKLWEIIQNNNKKDIIILVYNNIDKRGKFYNEFKEDIVEFNKLSPEVIIKHIMKDFNLNSEYSRKVVNRCDNDYSKVLMGMRKLEILSRIEGKNINHIYEKAIKDNLIPISNENILYDLIDCVLDEDIESVWMFLDMLKFSNESNLKLIGMIYTNLKNLMLVQSCKKGDNISQKTGLENWIINRMKDFIGVYETSTLVKSLKYLRDSEMGIKTGGIDENISLENSLINIYFEHLFN